MLPRALVGAFLLKLAAGQAITLSPTNVTAEVGGNVSLTCAATNVDFVMELLTADGQLVQRKGVLFFSGISTVFSLNNVSRAEKQLICQFVYQLKSAVNYLTIYYLYPVPQFMSGATMTLTASQSFYLNVTIVANPLPTITWYKGSTFLTSGTSFSAVGDTGVASLYFPSLTTSDAGVYTVNITNPVQTYEYMVTLNIRANTVLKVSSKILQGNKCTTAYTVPMTTVTTTLQASTVPMTIVTTLQVPVYVCSVAGPIIGGVIGGIMMTLIFVIITLLVLRKRAYVKKLISKEVKLERNAVYNVMHNEGVTDMELNTAYGMMQNTDGEVGGMKENTAYGVTQRAVKDDPTYEAIGRPNIQRVK